MAALLCGLAACGEDPRPPGCITDAQLCQLKKGTSTKADVMATLGKAQMFIGPDDWLYVCQQISGGTIVHNDITSVTFDDKGVLEELEVLRQGSGATPPPDCIK